MSLNDETSRIVRSNIIQEEPIPKVKKVLAWIYKEEQYRSLARKTPRMNMVAPEWLFQPLKLASNKKEGRHVAPVKNPDMKLPTGISWLATLSSRPKVLPRVLLLAKVEGIKVEVVGEVVQSSWPWRCWGAIWSTDAAN